MIKTFLRAMAAMMAVWAAVGTSASLAAEKLSVFFPAGRHAYQTNEIVHLCLLRQDDGALPAGTFSLTLSGEHGARLSFTFPMKAGEKASTEHVYLNGWLLRPGNYVIEAAAGNVKATEQFDIVSHVRQSPFVTADWGSRATGRELLAMGEESLGYNVAMCYAYGDDSVRGKVDWMQACAAGGGHQLGLRTECDWSDPYSILAGLGGKAGRVALTHSKDQNSAGVHLYDEPGLTWHKHPKTGDWTPHGIPAQLRSYQSAFGVTPLEYFEVDPKNPEQVARWRQWALWKLSLMEAAWRLARFEVEWVNPSLLTLTQSQYGWSAFTDGYYFNVVRSLPLICGHGGYDDLPAGYYCPSFFFDMGRARQYDKDVWYLPGWYNDLTDNRFRLEQYLTFMMGCQGLMTPPWLEIHKPSTVRGAAGIVESNKMLLRLGPLFTKLKPATRSQLGMLWSISQCIAAQTKDMTDNYTGGGHTRALCYVWLAGHLLRTPVTPIVEEDVLDGTLAGTCKALVVARVDYLEPRVVAALESWIKTGGAVFLTADCTVNIPGAVRLKARAENLHQKELEALIAEKKYAETRQFSSAGAMLQSALPLANELRPIMDGLDIDPAFDTDSPQVTGNVQKRGDIEYVFAINATYDDTIGGQNAIRPVTARIALPDDGRPVYDAMLSGAAPFVKKDGKLEAIVRFGAGQMHVFARPARPIGGVQTLRPVVYRDLTQEKNPVCVEVGALLRDLNGKVLTACAPLKVELIDPLGELRFRLFRATDDGQYRERLPLAANEASGQWRVIVTDLLAGTAEEVTFTSAMPAQCGAAAGLAHRAVVGERDWNNIYRFFRTFSQITIVHGKADIDMAAASRLAEALKPWSIQCSVLNAETVNKPRDIPPEARPTWSGLEETGRGTLADGKTPPISLAGFAVDGPVILIGTPEDNPLVKAAVARGRWGLSYLPFDVAKDVFPGKGRGLVAWTRSVIAANQDAVLVVGYDAEGLSEAVGTLYQIAAGQQPLTRWVQPDTSAVEPPKVKETILPEPGMAWQVLFPDRIIALKAVAGGAVVLANDGTLMRLDTQGKPAWTLGLDGGGEIWAMDASPTGNLTAVSTGHDVVLVSGAGQPKTALSAVADTLVKGIASLAVDPAGSRAFVSLSDGGKAMLKADGTPLWRTPGLTPRSMSDYEAALAEWTKGQPQRDAEIAAWKDAVAAWEKTDRKQKRPERPQQTPRPRAPEPDIYYSAVFSSDGRLVAAVGKGNVDILDAADGAVKASLPGFKPHLFHSACRAVAVGPDFLLTDGERWVRRYSTEQNKIVSSMQFAETAAAKSGLRPVAVAPLGADLVAGSEADYTVRLCKAAAATAVDRPDWQYDTPGFIPKVLDVRNGWIAVGYWGGLVRVLNDKGEPVLGTKYHLDVSALCWIGDDLLALALADGRVIGLQRKPTP